jgi:hypothetical protein
MRCYLFSLTYAKDNPILHYHRSLSAFINILLLPGEPIEFGCVHLLPFLANKLVHFGLLSDSGRRGRPAKGEIN